MEIISPTELASYLGTGVEIPNIATLVAMTNAEVEEAWRQPVDPPPAWVKNLALEVAARAARNPKGLISWTRSIDDGSRTERLPDAVARAGIYLTAAERRRLGGRGGRVAMGTMRIRPGY